MDGTTADYLDDALRPLQDEGTLPDTSLYGGAYGTAADAEGARLTAEFVHVPMWHFENLTGELRFRERATDWYGVPLWDGGWLVNSATPIGPAVALACCAKRMSLQDWMLFSERAATPGLLGKTAAAPGTEAWNNLCNMLYRWGRAWVGAVDKDTDITPVNLNTGTPPMPQLVERMDRAIAALYRGADLSTISKGEGLGASLQGEESDMLEADQCAEISEALHEQVDRFVIRYECGDDEPLAYIWIEPVSKPDVESNTKIDDHLAKFGVRLSKRDMLQRYGRAEAADEADALEPPAQGGEYGDLGGSFAPQTPPRGLPNAQPSCKDGLTPLQNSRKDSGGQGDDFRADAPEAVFRAFAEAVSEDAKPLAEQVKKLLDLIDAGKEAEAASFAASLSANLASYLPEDPESATVLAEAMAERYGQAWEAARRGGGAELANETDANGAEHAPAGSANGGQFVGKGAGGASAPSGTAKKTPPSALVRSITEATPPQAIAATAARAALKEGFAIEGPNGTVRFGDEMLVHIDSHGEADATGRLRRLRFAVDSVRDPDSVETNHRGKDGRSKYFKAYENFGMTVLTDRDGNGVEYSFDAIPKRKEGKK